MNDKEKKEYIKKELKRLEAEKTQITKQLNDVEYQLTTVKNLEKPYVACVQSYSGGGSMAFKTLEQAEKKLEEYAGKLRFKNGLNYGVYLFKYNDDGSTKEMLKEIPLNSYYSSPDLQRY